jgi:hypothetical protein
MYPRPAQGLKKKDILKEKKQITALEMKSSLSQILKK